MDNYVQSPYYRVIQLLGAWHPLDTKARNSIQTGITLLCLSHGERLTLEHVNEYLNNLEEYIPLFREMVKKEQEYYGKDK